MNNFTNRLKQWILWKLGIVSPSRYFLDSAYAKKVNERYAKKGLPDLATYVREELEKKGYNE